MKLRFVLPLLAVTLALVGCDTLDDAAQSVRDRFSSEDTVRTKTFTGSQRIVYEAVKTAAANMGYQYTHGGPAQGEFEAIGGVQPGDTSGSAQQNGLRVRLHESLDGASTDVNVRFTEVLESDSSNKMGMATESTMRDTPLYEVFFRNVQQALQSRPSAQPVGK